MGEVMGRASTKRYYMYVVVERVDGYAAFRHCFVWAHSEEEAYDLGDKILPTTIGINNYVVPLPAGTGDAGCHSCGGPIEIWEKVVIYHEGCDRYGKSLSQESSKTQTSTEDENGTAIVETD